MPASLNIKNPETHRLAEQLADLTGESMAAAVQAALRERLERVQAEREKDQLVAKLKVLSRHFASRMPPELRDLDIDAFLYDERGLPK